MDLGLGGKTVIVIGGSSNLGRACCLAFAKEGSNVVVAARGIVDCQKVADKCKTLGKGTAIAISVDATKLEPCKELVKKTLEKFKRVDVLVISMGWNRLAYFLDLEPKDWELIIATNYTATLNLLKVVLPVMIKQKSGNIVTMSSVIGRKGDPDEPVYGGLKAGQINLTHSLAMEMAQHGIRLNIVAPALTMAESPEELGGDSVWKGGGFTPEDQKVLIKHFEQITPMRKIAKPIDVAHAVLFFASDVMSGHVTGNVIGTDGGIYMGH
jgi:NAD(P)-dependent dehydrogenase (short-subunit alcohol dehydrogenase family)